MPFGIVACTFSDNLSRSSCIQLSTNWVLVCFDRTQRLCHKNIVFFVSQFFAEVIIYYLNPTCRVMKQTSNIFHEQALTMIIFLVIPAGIVLKLEKVGPTFSSFNPCASLQTVATDDRKQFLYLNIAFNIKTRPLFLEFN